MGFHSAAIHRFDDGVLVLFRELGRKQNVKNNFVDHLALRPFFRPHRHARLLSGDFPLAAEGQEIIASTGTLPIREDVPIIKGYGLVQPKEEVKRAMKIDYIKMISEKEAIIQKFTNIMRAK